MKSEENTSLQRRFDKSNNSEILNITGIINTSRKGKKAMEIIYGHCGKRRVFENYMKKNPEMARKYIDYIVKNPDAVYIRWDDRRKRFVD